MAEDVIERYGIFDTKVYLDELIFGHFNEQPIPYNYYNILNNDNEDGNNIPDTPVDNGILDNKVV